MRLNDIFRKHKMKRKSKFKNEAKFFLSWYSQKGKLLIFCSDLAWLENEESIIQSLEEKGEKGLLHIYLRELNHPIVDRLFDSGAYIYIVKASVKSIHRYSILEDNRLIKMIVRNKDEEKHSNYVRILDYYNDQAILDLLKDLLDDCYEKVFHKESEFDYYEK